MNPQLAALLKRAENIQSLIDDLCNRVEGENRNLGDAELTLIKGWKEDLEAIDRQVVELLAIQELTEKHAKSTSRATSAPSAGIDPRTAGITTEPRPVWRTAGEFIRDYVGSFPNPLNGMQPHQDMAARIQTHMEQRASQTTGDTPGLLPEPIIGTIHTDVDEDRPFVQSVGVKPLGSISGKTFYRPFVSTHTTVGNQSTELTPLPSGKLVVSSKAFTKATAGGSLEVSQQDIDWTDPAAWDAILADMAGIYAEHTDQTASRALETLVTQTTQVPSDDMDGWITALYEGAYQALTANGSVVARPRRIPNVVWTSADMWKSVGAAIDRARVQAPPEVTGLGSGGLGTVNGTILDLPRIMVPGLGTGTAIIGRTNVTEFYEQRLGVLQAVLPAKVGVELAVPGFYAYGTLDETAFCKITAPGLPLAAKSTAKG